MKIRKQESLTWCLIVAVVSVAWFVLTVCCRIMYFCAIAIIRFVAKKYEEYKQKKPTQRMYTEDEVLAILKLKQEEYLDKSEYETDSAKEPFKRKVVVDVQPNVVAKPKEKAAVATYKYPDVSLLDAFESQGNAEEFQEFDDKNKLIIEKTFDDFGVGINVLDNVTRSASITRYEVARNAGVKISQIMALADDIAFDLGVENVKMSPISGKAAIGIEVPNKTVSAVNMKELINSQEFRTEESNLSIALGKDIIGNSIVADISKMPHMLIAGTTGSGKSVCINSIIVSLIYKSSPEDVKFLMIDPKIVELGIYNGIPHMLQPVVTDATEAGIALRKMEKEMDARYKKFAESSVLCIDDYNRLPGVEKLSKLVIVIDELNDLMSANKKCIEGSICRLAQKARAAGIHLIIATQRPSADIITGVIKENIQCRIAFKTSSSIGSRIILDKSGAEKLLGHGDMLFSQDGKELVRIQGCFVSRDEIKRVVDFVHSNTLKAQMKQRNMRIV